MYDDENIVNALNDLIYNAIEHGADSGGSYNSNTENLLKSAEKVLTVLNLNDKYTVRYEWKCMCERVPVIVRRENV